MIFFRLKSDSKYQIGLEYIHDKETKLTIRLPVNNIIYYDNIINYKIIKFNISDIYKTMLRLKYSEIKRKNV